MTDATNETPAAQTPTGLTIQDLTLTLQVIQVASSRGAFKADELSAIGSLYDRIFKFLESTGAITTKAPEAEAPATPPDASATPTATVTETAPATKPAAKAAKKSKGK